MPGVHCRLMAGPAGSAGRCRRKRGEAPAGAGGHGIDGNGPGGHGVARNSDTDGAADGPADDGRGHFGVRKAMEVQVQVPGDRLALASGPGKPGLAPGCQS